MLKRVIPGLCLVGMFCEGLAAVPFTFTKVVDTDTPIPGGTGTFVGLDVLPALSEGNVAFYGQASSQEGIYAFIDGSLDVVADLSTPIPGGSSWTRTTCPVPSIVSTSSMITVKVRSTSVPTGSGSFERMNTPDRDTFVTYS